jgi:putative ABC transport system substrate-binding protein
MHADALYVGEAPFFLDRATKTIAHAARLAIPTVYFRGEFADGGGLMSYGTDTNEGFRVAGDYTGRILKGENPADLPVQLPDQVRDGREPQDRHSARSCNTPIDNAAR